MWISAVGSNELAPLERGSPSTRRGRQFELQLPHASLACYGLAQVNGAKHSSLLVGKPQQCRRGHSGCSSNQRVDREHRSASSSSRASRSRAQRCERLRVAKGFRCRSRTVCVPIGALQGRRRRSVDANCDTRAAFPVSCAATCCAAACRICHSVPEHMTHPRRTRAQCISRQHRHSATHCAPAIAEDSLRHTLLSSSFTMAAADSCPRPWTAVRGGGAKAPAQQQSAEHG